MRLLVSIISPLTRPLAAAWNADSKSGFCRRTSRYWICTFSACAVDSCSFKPVLPSVARIPTRDIPGIASLSSSSRLPSNPRPSLLIPVIFPPGRAKLTTNRCWTGSWALIMTIGIIFVACLAAWIAAELELTSTSTFSCTSSATNSATRSGSTLGQRYSMIRFFPST